MKGIDLKRILAEGGVIVASILVALAADAWWGALQDRDAERGIYESLWNDLGVLFAGAKGARDDHLRYASEIAELLDRLEVGETVPTDPRTDSLMARAFFQYRTYEPALEVVQSALERRDILTNADVTRGLVALPRLVEDMVEEEAVISREVHRWAAPVSDQTDVSHYLAIDFYDLQSQMGLPATPRTGPRSQVLVDLRMINGLHERLFYERFVIQGAVELVRQLDDIGWYLADELDRERSNPERPHPSTR